MATIDRSRISIFCLRVSVPQHVLNVADPEVLRKQRIKDINRKYDQLLEKINFMDHHLPQPERKYIYSNETLMPYIYFFKYMAKRPYDNYESEVDKRQRLKLWVLMCFHHLDSRHDSAK
jgi:hypothetical protein